MKLNNKNLYQYSKIEILNFFNVDENLGISKKDIEYKKRKYGLNTIEIKDEISFFSLYLEQVKSFLNLLLLFLIIFTFILWIFSNNIEHLIDSLIIILIFVFNTIVGAYQNYSSKKIAQTLKKMLSNKATVLRDNKKNLIDAKELFPGDIIYLSAGDKIPADCYLLKAEDLKVDESILTGESIAVYKNTNKILKEVEISDMKNIIFMNTYIVSGEAKAIVIKTGIKTQIGNIASSIQNKNKKISFINEIDEVSKKIAYLAVLLVVLVSIIFYIKGVDWISIFLIAAALILGSIPEGLPAIVVFLLSKSIHTLSKKEILVKDMGLLETLGSIDILCTDKTGTLTENKMSLKKLYLNGVEINGFENKKNIFAQKFSQIVSIVNDAKIIDDKLKGDPEDVALIEYLEKNDFNWIDIKKELKKDEELFEPFNSENKFSYSLSKKNSILKKGAPEILIKNCKFALINNKKVLLDDKLKSKFKKEMEKYSTESLRLIGFSYSENSKSEIFLGFCGLYDKPKEGVSQTIKSLYSAGIDVKMITGDNKFTAIAIGNECGFRNCKAVEFSEIVNLSDKEFEKIVLEYNIFARMTPFYKEKILKILQDNGHRVAITGDGVNDSIALKQADVGIVMGSGSDIAKESGDLILINNDFRTLPDAIREGRGIFHNIRKVVNYLLTANLAEVLTIFIASFFGLIPFTAIQILWVNFVTDIAPSLSLGVDKYPNSILKKKPNGKFEQILNKRIILLTIFISIKKTVLIFILFLVAYKFSPFENNLIFAQSIAFTWIVLSHFVRIAAIRFDENVKFFSNKYVNYSLLFVLILQLFIIYTSIGNSLFNVNSIPFYWVLILAGFIFTGIFLAKLITIFIKYLLKNYFKEVENY